MGFQEIKQRNNNTGHIAGVCGTCSNSPRARRAPLWGGLSPLEVPSTRPSPGPPGSRLPASTGTCPFHSRNPLSAQARGSGGPPPGSRPRDRTIAVSVGPRRPPRQVSQALSRWGGEKRAHRLPLDRQASRSKCGERPLRRPDAKKSESGPRRKVAERPVSVCGPDALSLPADAGAGGQDADAAAASLRAPRGGPSGRAGAASSSRTPAPPRSPETGTRAPPPPPPCKRQAERRLRTGPGRRPKGGTLPRAAPRPHHRPRPPRCPRPLGRLQAPPPGLTSGTKHGQRAGPTSSPSAAAARRLRLRLRLGLRPLPAARTRPARPLRPLSSAQPWPLRLGAASGAADQRRASP